MSGILAALAGIKTAIATAVDEYFNRVTLLLNTSSTNGAQNNTFLDSSSSPLTITRNGNTTQGTFTPFSQTGWSNYFDGSSNFTFASADTANAMGTGDWTFEVFVFPTVGGGTPFLFDTLATTSGTTTGIRVRLNSSNQVELWNYGSAVLTGGTLNLSAWNHVAITKASGTTRIYINGTSSSTYADSGNYTCGASRPMIASDGYNNGSQNSFTGYIANLRTVKGTAVYTGASLTVPTTPLTAITNTSLLICQSNRFKDNSTNAFAITANGTPSVQAFSPFAPTAAYDTAVVGGSGYFDGSGDYLATSGANAALGAGTFTIDGWFYSTGYNSGEAIYSGLNTYPASTGLLFYINGSGTYTVDVNGSNVISAGTAPLNAWTHFALVRSSTGTNGLALYINGVSIATGTTANNFTSTDAVIGRTGASAASNLWLGYLSGIRIVVGSANAPSGVPTAPPTSITNTQLLLNATNAGIYDSTAKNVLETVGNAQVSTTQAKWGTTSMYFDGTGDYLVLPYGQNVVLGSGDFTVEFFLYKNANTSYMVVGGTMDASSPYTAKWQIIASSDGTKIQWGSDSFLVTSTSSLSTGTWYHVAFSRASGTLRLFLDGVLEASASDSRNYNATNQMWVGQVPENTSARNLNGYIDDFRITKYARYTTTFTPPTAAFPLQ